MTQGGIQGDHKVPPCISHLEMRTHLSAMSCILLRVSLGFLDWVFPCCSCSRPLMFPCGENILGASLCTCQCHLLQSCLFLSSTFLFHCFCGVDDNLFCQSLFQEDKHYHKASAEGLKRISNVFFVPNMIFIAKMLEKYQMWFLGMTQKGQKMILP